MVVRLDGELDILTAPKISAQLNEVIRAHPSDMVLDLRDVESTPPGSSSCSAPNGASAGSHDG